MKTRATLKEELEKARVILAEAQENFTRNPEDYSAQLLLLSTENYISDLLRELDVLEMQKNMGACSSTAGT